MEEIKFITNPTFAHPFQDKKIVFTGAFANMTRSTAAKLVKRKGAIIQGNVTKETDFLILGSKRRGLSSKHREAIRLEMTAHPIQLLNEDDFIWLLSMND